MMRGTSQTPAEDSRGMTKPRLHRLEQLFVNHPIYFVTACTHNRLHLLANPAVHDALVQFFSRGLERQCYVGRYVLMPDHVHLFAAFATLDGASLARLSAWMKALKGSLSKLWRTQKIPPPHWQKGFFDHLLRSRESYSDKWQYVVSNPVRAGLVARWEDWPYQGEICRLEL